MSENGTVDDVGSVGVKSSWPKAACSTLLVTVWFAMLASWAEVETIVGSFPATVAVGSWVIYLGMRRTSWSLLCYGLSSFWCVSALCLIIAVFDMGPPDAETIVPLILTLYSLFLTVWCTFMNLGFPRNARLMLSNPFATRFSVRTMMGVTTVVCLLAAVGRLISWESEMWIFGSSGLGLLGITGAIAYWFALRLKQFRTEVERPQIDANLDY